MKKFYFLALACYTCFNFFFSNTNAQNTQTSVLYGAAMKLWDSGDISIGSLCKGGLGINIQPNGYVYFVSSLTGPAAWYNAVIANNDAGYANLVYRDPYGHVSWDRGDGRRYALNGFLNGAYSPGMENVRTIEDPLEIVTALRGVSYDITKPEDTTKGLLPQSGGQTTCQLKSQPPTDSSSGSETKNRTRCFGFSPEELREVLPEAVTQLSEKEGDYAINFDIVIPYLVESIKQLSREIMNITSHSNSMKLSIPGNELVTDEAKSSLFQNKPNPFSVKTVITFKLLPSVANASILVFDMQGSLVRSFIDLKQSCCEVTIDSRQLLPGMYMYSLITDGMEIDTKRLILTN